MSKDIFLLQECAWYALLLLFEYLVPSYVDTSDLRYTKMYHLHRHRLYLEV